MKRTSIFLLAIILLLFSGCQPKVYEVPLHQDIDNIVKIELSDHTGKERVVMRTLTDGDIQAFTEKLLLVPCYRHFNDPPTNYGYLSVYLYYENGDIDILGTDMCDVISDTASIKGWFYIKLEDMRNLFAEFVDPDTIPKR